MENNPDSRKIEIGEDTLRDINTTRKWTMFLAIIGFIGIGLAIIFGLFAGVFLTIFNTSDALAGFPEWSFFIMIILAGAIYLFPVFFLFRYSKHSANAVKTLDSRELHKALKNMKAYFVYIGILIIVMLIIYIVAFAIAGVSVALKGM
jgi:MFS family permease